MEPGYEIAPRPLDPSSRRRGVVAAVACLAVVVLVLVKPWEAVPAAQTTARPSMLSPSTAEVAPSATSAASSVTRGSAVTFARTWPVAGSEQRTRGDEPTAAELLAGRLAAASAGWGVGDGGGGPGPVHDDEWADWKRVAVVPATDAPGNIVVWPGTGLCTGLASVEQLPAFLAVSTPPGLAPGQLEGWWSDAARVTPLAGSVREIEATAYPTVRFLERLDGTPWPPGRYEIHVTADGKTFALTVCL